jgi:transcriptional regulator with GAF, ATPase, and Fis domain
VRWKIWPWRDAGQIGGIAIFTERITHQKQLEESHTEVGHLLAERERLLEIERAHGQRLDALRRSALSISMLGGRSATCLRELLQLIVDQARVLTSAEYGALGIGNDPARPFEPWVWSGISAGHAEKIGAMPRPIGLLGEVACKGRTLRVAEAHATMLPPHHPELGPYLAVPIQHREHPIGNFYMARRPGMTPFTSDDQSILELLADHAAIAIENETLYQHVTTEMRTREDVLAIVSHDLKSPLNAIRWWRRTRAPSPDRSRRCAGSSSACSTWRAWMPARSGSIVGRSISAG